jgi:hypothetical protein
MPKTSRTTAQHERTGPVEDYTADLPGREQVAAARLDSSSLV